MGGKFGGDVKMEVLWDERGLFALQGPKAVGVIERLSSTSMTKVSFGESVWLTLEGTECLVSRCGYTGEDGVEIFVPGDKAIALWRRLKSEPEVRVAGLTARDALRLEAGLCLYGHELDAETTPIEAGLGWGVPKSRRAPGAAPFLGSERILGQIADKKSYTKLRAGLFVTKGPPAREETVIQTKEGEPVGKVTSGTQSPCLRKNIAIGYINKPFNKQGTELEVVVRGRNFPAVVTKMPFVPTKYYKAP